MSAERGRYDSLMEVITARHTCRAFAPFEVPREHYEMILEAARHGPSGANTQPWHFVVITEPELKARISSVFVDEQLRRARLHMGFPTPNYKGVRTAPGVIVIVADFRWVRAFPLLHDGSDLDRAYRQNAERILTQSVAASTMAAHLAATALGYGVWWITAIGQEAIQREIKPLLEVPEDLAIIDVMCFGPPQNPTYTRHKRPLAEIVSWNRYNRDSYTTDEQIDVWIKTERSRWMYRDDARVD